MGKRKPDRADDEIVPNGKRAFMSLSHRCGEEYASSYADGLQFAFNSQDVCNIGIVGPYASGKTTIIKSYESCNNQRYVYITLGDYVRSAVQPSPRQGEPSTSHPVGSSTVSSDARRQDGSSPPAETGQPASPSESTKASREVVADLQNRIVEQLLCNLSPYGIWRASIPRFWRGANSALISLTHALFAIALVVSLVVSLDLFGIVTQAKSALDDGYARSMALEAQSEVLDDDDE